MSKKTAVGKKVRATPSVKNKKKSTGKVKINYDDLDLDFSTARKLKVEAGSVLYTVMDKNSGQLIKRADSIEHLDEVDETLRETLEV